MSEEKRIKLEENGRNPDGTFANGSPGGPGRKPETEEQKIIKKAQKEFIEEYKQSLAEALPKLSPVLVAKALEGDIPALKEVNDRVMGKAQSNLDVTTKGESLNTALVKFIDGKDSDNRDTSGIQETV